MVGILATQEPTPDYSKVLLSELVYRGLKNEGEYKPQFREMIASLGLGDFSERLYDSEREILSRTDLEERKQQWIKRNLPIGIRKRNAPGSDLINWNECRVLPAEQLSLSELLLVTGEATQETIYICQDKFANYTTPQWELAHRFAVHPWHARKEYVDIAKNRLADLSFSPEDASRLLRLDFDKIMLHIIENWTRMSSNLSL